jgi:hypothetical protein
MYVCMYVCIVDSGSTVAVKKIDARKVAYYLLRRARQISSIPHSFIHLNVTIGAG